MSRKHPWMAMKQAMVDYRRRLFAAGQPDHRQDDGRAIDREHDEGRQLDGRGASSAILASQSAPTTATRSTSRTARQPPVG